MNRKKVPMILRATDALTKVGKSTSVVVSDDELLRVKDVAAHLKCSLAQAYRLANDGLIPAFRVRGMVRVPRAPLMALIARNTSGGFGEMQ